MRNRKKRDSVLRLLKSADSIVESLKSLALRLLKSADSIVESLKSLALKLFELASLIYLLSKIVLHH
jgi:uncharacterized protein Yka (UPF0111/DUF47 family)